VRSAQPGRGREGSKRLRSRPPTRDPRATSAPATRLRREAQPDYAATFVLRQRFPALCRRTARHCADVICSLPGASRPLRWCVSRPHDLTLAGWRRRLRRVVAVWRDEYGASAHCRTSTTSRSSRTRRGDGCSNPHPHGQIWAQSSCVEPAKERRQQRYSSRTWTLLSDYADLELRRRERIVLANDHSCRVPFWATGRSRRCSSLAGRCQPRGARARRVDALADAVRRTAVRYDNLFRTSFPTRRIHQAPTDARARMAFHMHFTRAAALCDGEEVHGRL